MKSARKLNRITTICCHASGVDQSHAQERNQREMVRVPASHGNPSILYEIGESNVQ